MANSYRGCENFLRYAPNDLERIKVGTINANGNIQLAEGAADLGYCGLIKDHHFTECSYEKHIPAEAQECLPVA